MTFLMQRLAVLLILVSAGCGADRDSSTSASDLDRVFDADFVPTLQEFPVPAGSRPHDVAPATDGGIWYTAQRLEALGYLDPETGETRHIHLGAGAAPHGVIVGKDGAPWITDGGLNAIVRVDPLTDAVQVYPLPDGSARANLNTAPPGG
jgi:virginiamycin B lyase